MPCPRLCDLGTAPTAEEVEPVSRDSVNDWVSINTSRNGHAAIYRSPRRKVSREIVPGGVGGESGNCRLALGREDVNLHRFGHPVFYVETNVTYPCQAVLSPGRQLAHAVPRLSILEQRKPKNMTGCLGLYALASRYWWHATCLSGVLGHHGIR
jgi:hypothetical protein